MEIGDTVNLAGYDIQARIGSASGFFQVIIVHNNSTHLLVVVADLMDGCQHFSSDGMPEPKEGELMANYRYNEGDYASHYLSALEMALVLAIGGD